MSDNNDLWIIIDKQLRTSELFRESTHLHRCKNCGIIYSHSQFKPNGKLCTIRSDEGKCPECAW